MNASRLRDDIFPYSFLMNILGSFTFIFENTELLSFRIFMYSIPELKINRMRYS